MKMKSLTNKRVEKLVDKLMVTYQGDSGINFIDTANLPVRGRILAIIDELFEVLFPGHTGHRPVAKYNIRYVIGDILCQVHAELAEQIERAFAYHCRICKCDGCDCHTMAHNVTVRLLEKLPGIRDVRQRQYQHIRRVKHRDCRAMRHVTTEFRDISQAGRFNIIALSTVHESQI